MSIIGKYNKTKKAVKKRIIRKKKDNLGTENAVDIVEDEDEPVQWDDEEARGDVETDIPKEDEPEDVIKEDSDDEADRCDHYTLKQLIRKLHITEPVETVMCLIGKK